MKGKNIGTAKLKTYIHITRITIALCWIALFAFWAIKMFGGNFFEIVVNNGNFIKFSKIVETTWLKYFICFFTVAIANYLLMCAICQKFYFRGIQSIIIWVAIISIWAVSNFVPLGKMLFPSWYGYVVFIIIGIVFQKKWKKVYGLFPIILEPCFSIISVLTRNLPVHILSNYLICSILLVDVYLMIFLYYLYSNLLKLKGEIK